MKRFRLITAILLVAALMSVAVFNSNDAYAQSISLSPTSGFSTITITGSGFMGSGYPVTIAWDTADNVIPAVVYYGEVDFTAYITVPTQTEPGEHLVIADDGVYSATATFTVIDMTGSQGPQGIQGTQGLAGPQGIAGNDGIPGPMGVQGPQGPQGPAGSEGPPGIPGTSTAGIAGVVVALVALGLTVLRMITKRL